jgi:uncharacterized repeat protein (TIGR01451 family)
MRLSRIEAICAMVLVLILAWSLRAHAASCYVMGGPLELLLADAAPIPVYSEATFTTDFCGSTVGYLPQPAKSVRHGQVVKLTIRLTNTGKTAITRITAWVRLPPELDYVSLSATATGRYVSASRTVQWFIPTLNAGKMAVRTLQVKVR